MFRLICLFLLSIGCGVYREDWVTHQVDNSEIVSTIIPSSETTDPILVFGERNIPETATGDMRQYLQEHGGSPEFGFLSNCYPVLITVDGRVYPSSEHYYQAAKFEQDSSVFNEIVNAATPEIARKIAWQHEKESKLGDDQFMSERMKKALWGKFVKDDGSPNLLGMKLLATGDRMIVEGNYRIDAQGKNITDRRWGAELDLTSRPGEIRMQGKNLLGKLLMELRQYLQFQVLHEAR